MVMQQNTPTERVLAVQRSDLQQAAVYDSVLLMKLLALILEGLGALVTEDAPSLERFCKELNQLADGALSSTAEQLGPLAQKINQS